MTCASDTELVERFQQGDLSVVKTLVRRWEGPILRVAFRIVGDLAEAEDIRQTVFVRMLETLCDLRQPDRFAAWIRRSTVNTAISALRLRARKHKMKALLQTQHSALEAPQPDDTLADLDEAQQIAAALDRLQPTERVLLSLRFDEELTYREIAAVVEQPLSTVKSRVARAIERLRGLLGVSRELGEQDRE